MKYFPVFFISLLLLSCTDDEESNNIINNETMPQLIEIFPTASDNGDDIILHGKNFGGERGISLVYFNDVPAESYRIWADTVIHLTIPTGAVSGKVRIVKKAEEESNELYFTVKSFGGFPSVAIGRQVWMKRNLGLIECRNGTRLERRLDPSDWIRTNGFFCWAYPAETMDEKLGKLYGDEVILYPEKNNIAPNGWHVALKKDWDELLAYLGADKVLLDSNKFSSFDLAAYLTDNDKGLWVDLFPGSTNSTGFSALPTGYINGEKGIYMSKGETASWWYDNNNEIWCGTIHIYYKSSMILISPWNIDPGGHSIRCVRDE